MSKFAVRVTAFRPFQRNTLRGFCTVHVGEMHLTIHDIGVHQHANGVRWAALPGKPVLDRDGTAKRTRDGRIEYARLLSFDSRAVSDAFAAAVIVALLDHDEIAFDREGV
jgi:hypothetical protein